MTKNWINFRFLHICPVEKCEISPNLAKFHISPHLLCGKTEIPLHVEKFHVLKSEISPHGRFFLHLHVADRGDKYQVYSLGHIWQTRQGFRPVQGKAITFLAAGISCDNFPQKCANRNFHHFATKERKSFIFNKRG